MNAKKVKATQSSIDEIRKELDSHLVSLTLALEHEHLKKYAPKTSN